MIWTMGEMIVEIMRERENSLLNEADKFIGPFPSGAPANFIDAVARLGHKAGMIGSVGDDDFGKCMLDRFKKDGVDCSNVAVTSSVSTGCAFVTYFDDGSRKFIFHIGNSAAAKAKMPDMSKIPESSYFHIMGCSVMSNEDFGNEILKTMYAFKEKGTKISFDPNLRPELLGDSKLIDNIMKETNVFMPGVEELLSISKKDTVEEAVEECFKNENLEIITLKNGSKGCRIFTREEYFEMGVYKISPVDATGAGDAFDGAFLCGLCEGLTIEECAKMASAAAAINTAAFGPMEGDISPETVKNMIIQNEVV